MEESTRVSPTTNNKSPSSSSSTTPPSETTLADDLIEFETSELGNYLQPTRHANKREQEGQLSQSQPHQQQQRSLPITMNQSQLQPSHSKLHPITTDYESSAAEDSEMFTLGKYETAEYAVLAYSRTNKLDKLKGLLEAKARNEISLNLNFKGQQKQNFSWSALHLACYFGHIQVVELLLSRKEFRDEIDISIKNNSGDTPLHKATLTNRVQIVQCLLSNGANVFIKNCDGLFAKQLTSDKHIFEMLEAAEQADRILFKQNMFKSVDNGDLKMLQDYFHHYNMLNDAPNARFSQNEIEDHQLDGARSSRTPDDGNETSSKEQTRDQVSSADHIHQMTDERGNTLLHLAAMRGFKAICIYLLEQGLDPYRKNDLGQSCIDISSYQLRQLFMTVKPANSQLRRLSKERVTRFEGPLMKRVRLLGWKQIYVVLENGVILLFNNRKDSMNKSRRGYKYLESATCEPDPNDVGLFTVCFSDRSRATFLISPDHINQYNSFRASSSGYEPSKNLSCNQIELIRQKWIDSMRDHIVYSTDFIRKGLKLNDDDECDNRDENEVSSLNHLLPMDTIKSFFQEARAHYSILERHSESLCSLIQSLGSSNTFDSNSLKTNQRKLSTTTSVDPENVSVSTSSTGARLFGLIRGSRQANSPPNLEEELASQRAQHSSATNPTRARQNSLTNEFLRDSWPCVLFHLRLLMESTENTKTTLGQALTLMEHQEQLRQNRIQDQEERCRVLEDSLHALARDHHELEKSLSMSQIYHSANGCRSISMSTDLNEYFDAFDDFDDEKTMTPDSSSGDDEFDKKIQELMGEEGCDDRPIASSSQTAPQRKMCLEKNHGYKIGGGSRGGEEEEEDEECDEEDDIQSNCSALTVETVTDQYLSAADACQLADFDSNRAQLMTTRSHHRTRLPAPMIPRDQVSIWSILKNCIGKELSKITMPAVFNEPLTMLQRAAEGIQYCNYLKKADESQDPVERMELVCAFIIASISCNCHRIIKPFNPLLYETYEYDHELDDGTRVKSVAQQVSHHPPITAVCSESDNFVFNGVINSKIKFWGRSIEISHEGGCRIHLKRHNENYLFNSIACSVHNIIVGKLWLEHHGPLNIKCHETNLQANLTFKQAGWFSNDLHRFDGFIVSGLEPDKTGLENKKLRFVYGKWSDYIKSVNYVDYENYMRDSQQKLFRIPDQPDQGLENGLTTNLQNLNLSGSPNLAENNNIPNNQPMSLTSKTKQFLRGGDKKSNGGFTKSESVQSLDIPNSRTLWRLQNKYLSEYYNFTLFTMRLNELTPELEKSLPRTDSRFRPDVRKLEEADLDAAASEKDRLEEKQREARNRDKRFKDPSPDFLFFEQSNVPNSKEKFWLYKGGYWENKCNPSKFPELF